jgi:tRNA threonylcarbamoyladenosine biosynthesis protein TsaB
MMILAVELSSARRSVALCSRASGDGPPAVLGALADEGAAASRPLPLVRELLTQTGLKRELVDAIIVGLGPGSYTGIRSAIALAQGWQLARNTRTFGVSSIEALALQAQRREWFGEVSVVIDAQRHEFYLATYSITPQERQQVEPLRLVDLQTLRSLAAQPGALFIGPEVTRWISSGRIAFPEAEALAQLADPAFQSVPGEALEPIYLRDVTFAKAPPLRIIPP